MKDLSKLRKMYKLKEIYRHAYVQDRHESSAEHSWSCLMIADYFLTLLDAKLDRLKVYELLMYHDVVEIEAGDIPIHHDEKRKNKAKLEEEAKQKLSKDLPKEIADKFVLMFEEFEKSETPEAKFAHAIDGIDAIIHELDYPLDWKGWTEEMVRKYYEKYMLYPGLREIYEDLLKFVRENGYYNQ